MEEHLLSIKENIEKIRSDAAPFPGAQLMAVVKTRTPEEIRYAVRECGIKLIGENRVQELLAHYENTEGAEIHFIGTLQKNKVKYIIDKVSMIESLDSEGLAAEIDRHAAKLGIRMPVLIEINIGREPSKSGIAPEELPLFCEILKKYRALIPSGLMTVAPRCTSAAEYGVYFSEMNRLRNTVFAENFPSAGHPLLSMGMSSSYLPALENGADIIRIGEGIFGKRDRAVNK